MCSPELALAGAGATFNALGTYASSMADQEAGKYNAQVQRVNAQAAEWEANDALSRGMVAMHAVRRKGEQILGLQRTVIAGRGLALDEGSPLAILDETSYFNAVDVATTRSNSEKEAYAARVRGVGYEAAARMSEYRSDAANPRANALTSALSGAGQVSGQWYSRRGR